jgi:hypothetical protein
LPPNRDPCRRGDDADDIVVEPTTLVASATAVLLATNGDEIVTLDRRDFENLLGPPDGASS